MITRSIADQSSTTALYKISAADICQNNIDHCDIQKVEITDIHGLTQDITENYKNAGDGYIFAPDIATVRIVSVKK